MVIHLGIFLVSACSNKNSLDHNHYCNRLNLECVKENQLVVFKTSKGDFEAVLNAENYPLTVTNFIENIKKDIYTNKRFYKIIRYPQVKVIHAGIYQEKNKTLDSNHVLNEKEPSIPLEISLAKGTEYGTKTKESPVIDNIKSFFKKGSIAMVKSGESNSSSTEFFFVTNEMPALDGRYSVFGQILNGFEVLESINDKDFIYEINLNN